MLKKKSLITLVSLLVLLCVSVGGSLAFLVDTDGPVTNTFNPSKVTTSVEEDIETNPKVKQNVTIKNTGDTDAYIRATVVVTWQNKAGDVYGQAPVAGTNYTNWQVGNNWIEGNDGFYYYSKPVAPQTTTADALIAEIAPIGEPPAEGYYLTVEIIGSGVQSKGMGTDANGNPAKPVVLAWGIDPTTLGK